MLSVDLASDGVYIAFPVTRKPVISYIAFSPLPYKRRLFSVALSCESPQPDVIRHPALWSPDFPLLHLAAATIHLSSVKVYLMKFFFVKKIHFPWYIFLNTNVANIPRFPGYTASLLSCFYTVKDLPLFSAEKSWKSLKGHDSPPYRQSPLWTFYFS